MRGRLISLGRKLSGQATPTPSQSPSLPAIRTLEEQIAVVNQSIERIAGKKQPERLSKGRQRRLQILLDRRSELVKKLEDQLDERPAFTAKVNGRKACVMTRHPLVLT